MYKKNPKLIRVNRAKWKKMQVWWWCELWVDYKGVFFPIQCENIIHARHLMLYKTALGEGRALYRLHYFSHFPVTPLPSRVPRSCPVPVDILSSDWHWANHVHVASAGPALSWGQAGGPGHPCRHQSGTMRCFRLHSDSFLPHRDIRHSQDSELTALSPAMSVLSQIYLSLPRDSDVLRICMECGSQYVVFHFISWFYHPFPITDQAHGLRSTRENLTVLFPILDQVSWTFALWLPLNNSV